LSRIRDADVAEAEFRGRIAAVAGAPGIERDHCRFREHPVESRIVNLAHALGIGRGAAVEGVLVGEKEGQASAVSTTRTFCAPIMGRRLCWFRPVAPVRRRW